VPIYDGSHYGDSHVKRMGDAGQSLVETALILPVLLLLLMGVWDFGRAIYAYISISNAARDGARVAIVDQRNGMSGQPLAAEAAADQATSLGLSPNTDVDVAFLLPDGSPCVPVEVGCIARVDVRYTYTAMTPIIGNVMGALNLSSRTELPVENTRVLP